MCLPPPPTLHLSADDLASYFTEKTEAFRRNPSPFHTHLPFFCIHTGLSSFSVAEARALPGSIASCPSQGAPSINHPSILRC